MSTRTIPFGIDKSDGSGLLTSGVITATVQYGAGEPSATTVTQRTKGWSVDVDDTQDALVVVSADGATTFGLTIAKIPAFALEATAQSTKASADEAARPGAEMALTAQTMLDTASAIEAAIIDDQDQQRVLNAMVTAIQNADLTIGEISTAAVAEAVRVTVERTNGLLDLTKASSDEAARPDDMVVNPTLTQEEHDRLFQVLVQTNLGELASFVVDLLMQNLSVGEALFIGPGVGSVRYEDTITGRGGVGVSNAIVRAYAVVDNVIDFAECKGSSTTSGSGAYHLNLDPGTYARRVWKNGTVVLDDLLTIS